MPFQLDVHSIPHSLLIESRIKVPCMFAASRVSLSPILTLEYILFVMFGKKLSRIFEFVAGDFGEALMKPNKLAPVFWSTQRLRSVITHKKCLNLLKHRNRDSMHSAIRGITLPKLRVAANLPIFSSMQSAMTSIPAGPKLPGTRTLRMLNERFAEVQLTVCVSCRDE